MKRLVGITGIILMLCLFVGMGASPSATVMEQTTATQGYDNTDQDEVFILKEENNKIVVYKKGENTPFLVTETFADSLPKGDLMSLKNGIEIVGRKNLKKSLEDYCS